jgi:hypothetical protein
VTAAFELVARLQARGVDLRPDGADLVIRPAGAVRPEEVEALRQHKAEVLAMLAYDQLSGWPATLPGLGRRAVVPFVRCVDCAVDRPADEPMHLGSYTIDVPGPTHTFVTYGGRALCRRHANTRAGR